MEKPVFVEMSEWRVRFVNVALDFTIGLLFVFACLFLGPLLGGCATIDPRNIETGIGVSADCQEAYALSRYWRLVFGSDIRKVDADVITAAVCKKGAAK